MRRKNRKYQSNQLEPDIRCLSKAGTYENCVFKLVNPSEKFKIF